MKKQIERIEKQGEPKFTGRTTAKTMRGWIIGRIEKFSKKGNVEYEFLFKEILNAYNKYHPEKKVNVSVESWKGKSSIDIIKDIDKMTVIKYQKPDKESEPKEDSQKKEEA